MKDFRQLSVWQKAHQLIVNTYKASRVFPKDEIYGLTSQMRRSCSSIPANIAEGCGRGGEVELNHFLQIAQGSASELEYHFLLANELGYLEIKDYSSLSGQLLEVRRMLTNLIKKIRHDNN